MASGEFRHKNAIAGRVREDEYESIQQHILNNQAKGDIVYAPSATQLGRLAIGATDTILSVQGGVPTWRTPANILADLSNYAGIYVEGNSNATTINVQHGWEQLAKFDTDMPENISNGVHGSDNIIIGATGVYEVKFNLFALGGGANKIFEIAVFKLAQSGSAITSSNEANPVSVLATAHGFSTGYKVKITGVGTATILNNRIFTITVTDVNNFTLQEDNGGNIDGTGIGIGSGGTATLVTELKQVHADRKWSANDVGAVPAGGLVSLVENDILEMYAKNITDATNFTMETCQFMVHRVG